MFVTQGLKILAYHVKQLLLNMVNIGQKKRAGALGTGANRMNNGPQLTTREIAKYNTILQ